MVSRGRIALKNVPEPVEVFAIASLGGGDGRAAGRYKPSIKTAIVALGCIAVLAGGLAWLATGNRTAPGPAPPAATAPGATTRGKPVIAVLPFANLGGDASQDYFSDGLTEDLISDLGRFNSIAVLARPAVERFRKGDMPLADIRRALDARYVVQGSVRRNGDRLRLSVQLADTSTATVIWSQQFEADTKDLFTMQSEIVTQIAGKLAMQVSERETRLAAQKPTASLEAYDHVLRGRDMMNRLARAANIEARGHFLKAIELDPNYAAAHAGAAKTYLRAVLLGWTAAPDDTLTQAETIARKALSLDANNVEAYVVLAGTFTARGDYDQALTLARKAIALNPSDAEAYLGFGTALLWIGKPDEAIAALETARTLGAAFDEADRFHLGLAYFMKRRYGDALQTLIDPVSGAPHLSGSLAVLAAIYAETGEDAKARNAYAELKRNAPYFDVERFGDNLRDREEAKRLGEAIKRAAAL
jgi:TolB-like protein/Flp pilus assembly protein TadD